jgi:hypothetical protein
MQVSDSMPGRFHFGDITSDGFPDLVMTLLLTNGQSKSQFFLNRPCTLDFCSQKAIAAGRRSFQVNFTEVQESLLTDNLVNDVIEINLKLSKKI